MREWRMAAELALQLTKTIERELPNLRSLTEEQASLPRGPGKWSPKEELGHLIDSAANNHIRIAVAALEGQYRGPGYAQEEWVSLHGYLETQWTSIVDSWFDHNRLLSRLVQRIPESRLDAPCSIGGRPPVTLGFVIEDYILHMQHHVDQLLRREVVTEYPGAKL